MGTTSQASQRISALLDENSFVEIGARITARATDFNLKQTETPSDGVITGYGVIGGYRNRDQGDDSGLHAAGRKPYLQGPLLCFHYGSLCDGYSLRGQDEPGGGIPARRVSGFRYRGGAGNAEADSGVPVSGQQSVIHVRVSGGAGASPFFIKAQRGKT